MKLIYKILVPFNVVLALVLTTIVMANVIANNSSSSHKPEPKPAGTQVEIFASNGKLLATQTLIKKEMAINFCDAKLGVYTVRLTKGDSSEEFHYVKK